jgi:hypothetical protein
MEIGATGGRLMATCEPVPLEETLLAALAHCDAVGGGGRPLLRISRKSAFPPSNKNPFIRANFLIIRNKILKTCKNIIYNHILTKGNLFPQNERMWHGQKEIRMAQGRYLGNVQYTQQKQAG